MIIDGYNLIGRQQGLRGEIERKRRKLLADLSRYQRIKGHPITVVFDGWRSEWAVEHEERVGGISVIFSRRGERADAVIARLAREMGSACVVVTSDREVQRAARASGATPIFSGEFEDRLSAILTDSIAAGPPGEDSGDETPMRPQWSRKKGNPAKRSKAERRRMAKLKKL